VSYARCGKAYTEGHACSYRNNRMCGRKRRSVKTEQRDRYEQRQENEPRKPGFGFWIDLAYDCAV
jgi:hypothetical protein